MISQSTNILSAGIDATTFFVFALVFGIWALLAYSKRVSAKKNNHNVWAAQVSALQALELSIDKPDNTQVTTKLEAGEVFIGSCTAALLEYKKGDRNYQGINQGLSFKVTKNIRYNVGGSKGKITSDPDYMAPVDQGKAVFTNQRIIYIGQEFTRQFDLGKILDYEIAPNGFNFILSLSNAEKRSGLQTIDTMQIWPGLLFAVAHEYNDSGLKGAKTQITTTLEQFKNAEPGVSPETKAAI